MSFKRYEAYKDSGVEWLGEVPGHWEVRRIRFAAALNPSKSEVAGLPGDTPVTFLPMEAIGERGEVDASRERPLEDVLTGYTYLREGDVAFAKITPCFENGKGALFTGLTSGVAFGTTELTVARPRPGISTGEFLHWFFSSAHFRKRAEAAMYGAGGQKRVPDDFVRDFEMWLPPLPEQQAIATFLDRETARIDALVAEQQRLIALLQEKRQAVISHAVTKGLDPTVPMKDSGVAWLGEVPEHWTVMPIRFAAKLESGHTPSRSHPEYWLPEECTIPWFTLSDVWQLREERVEYALETKEKVSATGIANSAARLLPGGTVMLSRTASVGYSGIMGVEMATTQDFANWVCGKALQPEFLLYVFRAMKGEFERLKYGSTHNTIYMPDIMAFRFALPPLDEQSAIVQVIRERLAGFDDLLGEAARAVSLLQERRTALISAAVTGQIDVRTRTEALPA